jgi:hypothetical protein
MAVAANGKSPSNGIGNRQKSTMTDLKVWQQYYRAQAETADAFPVALQPQSAAADVLLALSKYDSAIKEVRQARHLPDSRFPLEYDKEDPWAILLPHLAALKGCSQVLQLRAIAELQNGQSEQALDDVMLTLRLTDSIRTEPFLIRTWCASPSCKLRCNRSGKAWSDINGRTLNSLNWSGSWPGWIFCRITNSPCTVNWCFRAACLTIYDAIRSNFPIFPVTVALSKRRSWPASSGV